MSIASPVFWLPEDAEDDEHMTLVTTHVVEQTGHEDFGDTTNVHALYAGTAHVDQYTSRTVPTVGGHYLELGDSNIGKHVRITRDSASSVRLESDGLVRALDRLDWLWPRSI